MSSGIESAGYPGTVVMAEGPVDEIRKLQVDIDAYIQHLEAAESLASS